MPEHTKKAWEIARERCESSSDWHEVLSACEERYRKYNWIHAYPNACCLVTALYFGEGDFEKTLHIITMCGLDADCNAGVIMPVIGISRGIEAIPRKFMHPVFEKLTIYMRGGYAEISTDRLTDMTVSAVLRAYARPAGGK